MGVLRAAVAGRFPPGDGGCTILPPDATGTHAVVAFTGHAFVLTDRRADDPVLAAADGYGGATHPSVLLGLAGPEGWVGSHDAVLAHRATGSGGSVTALAATDRFDGHPRVTRAREHRSGVRVLGDERGLVTVGEGLAGRTEISVEVVIDHGGGVGRELLAAALAALPDGELVFAQVAPGNAASLRMFLACGFVPIGSEVLLLPAAVSGRGRRRDRSGVPAP